MNFLRKPSRKSMFNDSTNYNLIKIPNATNINFNSTFSKQFQRNNWKIHLPGKKPTSIYYLTFYETLWTKEGTPLLYQLPPNAVGTRKFSKKREKLFATFRKSAYLCTAIEKNNGSVAQLNRAFDYGSKGYRFESCRSHKAPSNWCFFVFLN